MKHLITIIAALILSATSASAQEAYALMSTDSTTLTFYYDTQKATREGTAFEMNVGDSIPHWLFQEYFGQKYTQVEPRLGLFNAKNYIIENSTRIAQEVFGA